MKIRIIKSDMKNGKPGACYSCAFALALKRKYPRRKVSVVITWFDLNNIHYEIPQDLQKWIARWERGQKVEPKIFNVGMKKVNIWGEKEAT